MARQMATTHTGLPFTVTDAGRRYMVGKDACHDSLAWVDLDGDGIVDLVGIATESGNYEDIDHELVAIQVPTGNALWRALPGEVSKRVSFVNGVIVASTRSASRLVGLDPRTGQKLWDVGLPDLLDEDNFDDDRARAIQPFGGVCAIQCKDDTYHLVDARSGQLVKSGEGKWKPLGGGVPGLAALEMDEHKEIWHVPSGRKIADLKDTSQVRVVPGPGYFALLRHGAVQANGAYGFEARIFGTQDLREMGRSIIVPGPALGRKPSDDDDDDGGAELRLGDGEFNVIGGCIMGNNRLVFGSRYHSEAYVVDLAAGRNCPAHPFPPPKPGFKFRTFAWAAPLFVSVWEKEKGTSKLIVMGHHPQTLAPVWMTEDLGGRSLSNTLHLANGAVLVPRNPGPGNNEYQAQTNPCSIRHLDPATGAVVTDYPVEDVDCIEMFGQFLCGAPTYFSGGLPIVYDTQGRKRVL